MSDAQLARLKKGEEIDSGEERRRDRNKDWEGPPVERKNLDDLNQTLCVSVSVSLCLCLSLSLSLSFPLPFSELFLFEFSFIFPFFADCV